jgi:hypothetical protein
VPHLARPIAALVRLLAPFAHWSERFQTGGINFSFLRHAARELVAHTSPASAVVKSASPRVQAIAAYFNTQATVRYSRWLVDDANADRAASIAEILDPRTLHLIDNEPVASPMFVRRVFGELGYKGILEGIAEDLVSLKQEEEGADDGYGAPTASMADSLKSEARLLFRDVKHGVVDSALDSDVAKTITSPYYVAKFPKLSLIARSYLAATAANADPERANSAAEYLLSPSRNRMAPDTLEALTVLTTDSRLSDVSRNFTVGTLDERIVLAERALSDKVGHKQARREYRARKAAEALAARSASAGASAGVAGAEAAPAAQAGAGGAVVEVPAIAAADVDEDADDLGAVMADLLEAGAATLSIDGGFLVDHDALAREVTEADGLDNARPAPLAGGAAAAPAAGAAAGAAPAGAAPAGSAAAGAAADAAARAAAAGDDGDADDEVAVAISRAEACERVVARVRRSARLAALR